MGLLHTDDTREIQARRKKHLNDPGAIFGDPGDPGIAGVEPEER